MTSHIFSRAALNVTTNGILWDFFDGNFEYTAIEEFDALFLLRL